MYKQNVLRKLSWKQINLFLQCSCCFYKDQILKLKRPGIDPDSFSLNNAIDALWKNEIDQYRYQKKPHPLMIENNINAIPFSGNLLYMWRDYQAGGIRALDSNTSLEIFGIIDDIWITPNQELIIVDYKVTTKHKSLVLPEIKSKWIEINKKQIGFYANLLKKNGYKVHPVGYYVFNSVLHDQLFFNQRLNFETIIQPYIIDDSWIQQSLLDIKRCLDQNVVPEESVDCEYCKYVTN